MKLAAFTLWLATLLTANAATYYVAKTGNDGNAGSVGSPWLTIQHAASTIASADTVNVATGTYSEYVTIATRGAFVGTAATLDGATISSGADSTTLTGFAFDSSLVANNRIMIVQASSCTISACTFDLKTNFWGIENTGNLNIYTGCTFTGGTATTAPGNMFTIAGTSNLVTLCYFHDIVDVDIFKIHGDQNRILSNEVTSVSNPNVATGEHADFIQMFQSGTNVLVERNYVHDCPSMQIGNIEFGVNGGTTTTTRNLTVRNNIFASVSSPLFVGVPNTLIYNNIFYACGTSTDQPILWYEDSTHTSVGGEVVNNVFLICGAAPGNDWIGAVGSGGADLTTILVDYNYYGGTAFAAKSAANGAYIGTHAVNGGDPKLNLNWSLQAGSPLIGAGTSLAVTFTDDYKGATRAVPWDIGAYKYGGTLNATTVNFTTLNVGQ